MMPQVLQVVLVAPQCSHPLDLAVGCPHSLAWGAPSTLDADCSWKTTSGGQQRQAQAASGHWGAMGDLEIYMCLPFLVTNLVQSQYSSTLMLDMSYFVALFHYFLSTQ